PYVAHYFAYVFRLSDMLDEALAAEQIGHEMDPSGPWCWFGVLRVRIIRGELDEAWRIIEQTRTRFPGHPRFAFYEGMVHAHEGRIEKAIELCDLALSIEPAKTVQLDRALLLARAGRVEEARLALTTLDRAAWIDMDSAAIFGAVLGTIGETDRAFA